MPDRASVYLSASIQPHGKGPVNGKPKSRVRRGPADHGSGRIPVRKDNLQARQGRGSADWQPESPPRTRVRKPISQPGNASRKQQKTKARKKKTDAGEGQPKRKATARRTRCGCGKKRHPRARCKGRAGRRYSNGHVGCIMQTSYRVAYRALVRGLLLQQPCPAMNVPRNGFVFGIRLA